MLKNYFKEKPEPSPEPSMPDRIQGKIYFLHKNGYGFIESSSLPQKRIYFHWKGLRNIEFADLKRGDTVEFTPKKYEDKNSWNALGVTRL